MTGMLAQLLVYMVSESDQTSCPRCMTVRIHSQVMLHRIIVVQMPLEESSTVILHHLRANNSRVITS